MVRQYFAFAVGRELGRGRSQATDALSQAFARSGRTFEQLLDRSRRERRVRAAQGAVQAMSLKLNRRTMLRGVGGALVGLPLLECMIDSKGVALRAGHALPKRYAIVFAGQAHRRRRLGEESMMVAGVRSTADGHFIAPAQAGAGYTLTTPLQPLARL